VFGVVLLSSKYLAFGLVIDSPIPLPEAYPAEPGAVADVTVTSGVAGADIPKDDFFDKARENRLWWMGIPDDSRTLFNCPSGLFEIRNGSEVVMQLYPDADMELAKIFLLGSAMGAVQIQRGRIPVHGGAVVTPRGAMIITGGQGAGKSTMTSAFVHNGYKYLTDDVSSVRFEDGRAFIVPAYPQRKLVRDACAPLGYDPDSLILVDGKRDKLAIRDVENWQREPTELSLIIELHSTGREDEVSVEPVRGHAKLACVLRNLYRMWMHTPGGNMHPAVFKKILSIAEQADVFRVGVPRDIERVASIALDIAAALEAHTPEPG